MPIQKQKGDGENATYVVCVPASTPAHFDDDVIAECCECGQKVRHRPHVPKKPKRICTDCISQQFGSLANLVNNPDAKVLASEKTIEEVAMISRKKQH